MVDCRRNGDYNWIDEGCRVFWVCKGRGYFWGKSNRRKGWGYEFYPEVAPLLKYNLNQQRGEFRKPREKIYCAAFLVGGFELDGLQKEFVDSYKNVTKTHASLGKTPVKIVNSEHYNEHLSEFANSLWSKVIETQQRNN
jgi:hypothetical protein